MSIALNPKDLERAQRLLRGIKGGAQIAVTRALNRTAQGTKTQLSKQLTAKYNVKSGAVRPALTLQQAKPKKLEARVDIRSGRVPLDKFKFSPKHDTTGSPHRKVTVEIIKGSPFTVKKGFVWNGHVFQRQTTKSLPIEKLTGPAVAQMANSKNIISPAEDFANELLVERINHEITVLLNKWDKK